MKAGTREITPYTMTVLNCIEEYYAAKGFSPTLREISEMMGGGSTSSIRYAMTSLENLGYLTPKVDGRARTQVPTFKLRYTQEYDHG